jgi:DNA-binding Xre family transcriptional regulator
MPRKIKDAEERLQTIEYLLAGILLDKKPTLKELSKIIGCSDNILSKLYPEKKVKKNAKNKK